MLHFIGQLPREKFFVACSGGPDSMAVLSFLVNGKRRPTVAYFDHGTEHGKYAKEFVIDYCKYNNLEFFLGDIQSLEKPAGESKEEFWSKERNNWFHSLPGIVVTAHNLDDAVEWWVFSSLHGIGKLIPYNNDNVIRPFLITTKAELKDWLKNKDVPYIDDPSNSDVKYARNRIRHEIIPVALKINPGLYKVIKKKLIQEAANG